MKGLKGEWEVGSWQWGAGMGQSSHPCTALHSPPPEPHSPQGLLVEDREESHVSLSVFLPSLHVTDPALSACF